MDVSADRGTAGNHDVGSGWPVTTGVEDSRRLYTGRHWFHAGIDLHARSLYAHVMDERGRTVLDRKLPGIEIADLLPRLVGTEQFLRRCSRTAIAPFSLGAGADLVKPLGGATPPTLRGQFRTNDHRPAAGASQTARDCERWPRRSGARPPDERVWTRPPGESSASVCRTPAAISQDPAIPCHD